MIYRFTYLKKEIQGKQGQKWKSKMFFAFCGFIFKSVTEVGSKCNLLKTECPALKV